MADAEQKAPESTSSNIATTAATPVQQNAKAVGRGPPQGKAAQAKSAQHGPPRGANPDPDSSQLPNVKNPADNASRNVSSDTPKDLPIRVLYIHGLELFPDRQKARMVEDVFGKDNVAVPDLMTKRTLTLFVMAYAIVLLLLLSVVVVTFVKANWIAGSIALIALTLVALLLFILAGRGVTHLMLRQAVVQAEASFRAHRSNVIVASSFGAVVALQMDAPLVPLILLSPAQDQYYRYMHIRPYASIGEYPYAIVIHGSSDTTVPLDDSIRLVETCELGRCRLEVVDDDHRLTSLTETDFKNWIEEAYERGREVAVSKSKGGNKKYDLSLFEPLDEDLKGVSVS